MSALLTFFPTRLGALSRCMHAQCCFFFFSCSVCHTINHLFSFTFVQVMSFTDDFRGLDRDIEGSPKRWKKLVESECPEKEKFPQEWKGKSSLQKLIMIRALRPDRLTYALRWRVYYAAAPVIPWCKALINVWLYCDNTDLLCTIHFSVAAL